VSVYAIRLEYLPGLQARSYIDPGRTLWPHVREDEVMEVLEKAGEGPTGRNGSRTARGQTASVRHLWVIYVPDSERVACL
jgi:hypothetical protein